MDVLLWLVRRVLDGSEVEEDYPHCICWCQN
jgi:hypothetical protein